MSSTFLKQGLPAGAVKNAMQRDGLDPGKYISMSKVGLPDGAVRNAMQRDGLNPSLMDVLKNLVTSSNSIEGRKDHSLNEDRDEIVPTHSDKYYEEEKRQAYSLTTNASMTDNSDSEPETTIDTKLVINDDVSRLPMMTNDPQNSKISNRKSAIITTNETQSADESQSDRSPMSIAAMAAAAAKKKKTLQTTAEDSKSSKSSEPMSIAAMAAAAAKKNTSQTTSEESESSTSSEPMSIAAMAAAAAKKKTSQTTAEDSGSSKSSEPMSIAAMAAAAVKLIDVSSPSSSLTISRKEAVSSENKDSSSSECTAQGTNLSLGDDNSELPIKDDPSFSKFFKMLKMGLPIEVVKHAMQRDGADPTIMDLDHEKSLVSQRPSNINSENIDPPLMEDEKYQKYFKMLKMVSFDDNCFVSSADASTSNFF